MDIGVELLPHGEGLALPAYATRGSAGLDLRAAVGEEEGVTLQPGHHAAIPLGFKMDIPEGYEAQIRPRSGLAFKHRVTVLNSPGTIDAGYPDEVKALLINLGDVPFSINRGDRIAQMVIAPVTRVQLVQAIVRGDGERIGGFGSTGQR